MVGVRRFDLNEDLEGLLMKLDGLAGLAEGGVGAPEVAEVIAPRSSGRRSRERWPGLFMKLDGLAGLAEGGVGIPKVAEGTAFGCPVTDSREMARDCS